MINIYSSCVILVSYKYICCCIDKSSALESVTDREDNYKLVKHMCCVTRDNPKTALIE